MPAWQTHHIACLQPLCDLHKVNARPFHKGCLAFPTSELCRVRQKESGETPGLPGGTQIPSGLACSFVARLPWFKSLLYHQPSQSSCASVSLWKMGMSACLGIAQCLVCDIQEQLATFIVVMIFTKLDMSPFVATPSPTPACLFPIGPCSRPL